jgi:hypothetical protein
MVRGLRMSWLIVGIYSRCFLHSKDRPDANAKTFARNQKHCRKGTPYAQCENQRTAGGLGAPEVLSRSVQACFPAAFRTTRALLPAPERWRCIRLRPCLVNPAKQDYCAKMIRLNVADALVAIVAKTGASNASIRGNWRESAIVLGLPDGQIPWPPLHNTKILPQSRRGGCGA